MSAANERAAVGGLLSDWTLTPVAWPNQDFTPPAKSEWLAVTIQQADAFQIEIGAANVVHRHPGIVVIQVFSPSAKGDKRALEVADLVAAKFRRKRVEFTNGTMVFRTPTIRAIGAPDVFYQVNVSVPYYRDELF